MKKTIAYLLSAAGLTLLYQLLLLLTLSATMAVARPNWWPVGIMAASDGLLAWMHLSQGFGVLLAALVIAWLIRLLFRHNWVSLSFLVCLLPVVFMLLPLAGTTQGLPDLWWSSALDTGKIVLLPPLCCWVMIKSRQLYHPHKRQ